MKRFLSLIIILTGVCGAAMSATAADIICNDNRAEKQALFGDLHVHTSYSMDAYTFDTLTGPDVAYRFARGETINIAPLDAEGKPGLEVRIDRPLDFAAVTDHAENFGGVSLCTRSGSPVYDTESCKTFRGGIPGFVAKTFEDIVKQVTLRSGAIDADEVCGVDGRRCRDAIDTPWAATQRAAEQYYDRSPACAFTTFVGYEYSLTPEMSKVHRNIIFRNEKVIRRPLHAMHISDPLSMLAELRAQCIEGQGDAEGCDVVSIPHNSNFSDGRMFRADYGSATSPEQQVHMARLRAQMEPIVEIMQVKGDSECSNGLPGVVGGADEFCDFEKMRQMRNDELPYCNGEIGAGALMGKGCIERNDFARYALALGLQEQNRIGVNPFQFGFAASTDAHEGTMGDTSEASWSDTSRPETNPTTNPGGLIGVWATQNSRDAVFDSIQAKEVFGTSGTRIQPRFFGGWNLDEQLCGDDERWTKAYQQAVPMGSVLSAGPENAAPSFLVSADADTQASKLQRVQVVKVWPGDNGDYEQRVYTVAGGPMPAAAIDDDSCAANDIGHQSLCSVWQDPEFDPGQSAAYYSRVLEVPSCRWSRQRCDNMPADKRSAWCDDARIPATIQERAWTSPIWFAASEVPKVSKDPEASDVPEVPEVPEAVKPTQP